MEEQRQDELMHYGRKGMKWGQHIYADKNKQARKYQRELNKADNESSKAVGKYFKADVKRDRYMNKAYKQYLKKGDAVKTPKASEKARKLEKNYQDTYKTVKKMEQDRFKRMAEMYEEGYEVSSKMVMKNTEKGRTAIQTVLTGPIGNAAINSVRYSTVYKDRYPFNQTPFAVQGNKYKVKPRQ